MRLSIIIPVLDEATTLPPLLTRLQPLPRRGVEVLFVDGGSTDGSASLITQAGFRLLHAPRGRASQMNAGAAAACGDCLLFLHADTLPPADFESRLRAAIVDQDYRWGCFNVTIDGRSRWLPVVAALMNLRSRLTRIATGDQAIFVTRAAFDQVGGFPALPLMEDIELSRRLRSRSRPARIAVPVCTSGRRWESRGVWRTILLMWRLRWAYWRGAAATDLARAYR